MWWVVCLVLHSIFRGQCSLIRGTEQYSKSIYQNIGARWHATRKPEQAAVAGQDRQTASGWRKPNTSVRAHELSVDHLGYDTVQYGM